jgi:aspartyl-tRNA(Asn)/glutamyl-tRNA(Gln) amidotransferase subunit C
MISKQEIHHIAKLARLRLAQGEIEKYQKELSKILDYIEKLKEVDVSEVEPTSHPLKIKNVMREDKEKWEGEIVKKILDLMPEKENNYLKVKKIIPSH